MNSGERDRVACPICGRDTAIHGWHRGVGPDFYPHNTIYGRCEVAQIRGRVLHQQTPPPEPYVGPLPADPASWLETLGSHD